MAVPEQGRQPVDAEVRYESADRSAGEAPVDSIAQARPVTLGDEAVGTLPAREPAVDHVVHVYHPVVRLLALDDAGSP